MNIALTGATGFIGSRLKEKLETQGHQVLPVGRGVRAEDLASLFRRSGTEVVFHLASLCLVEHSPEQIEPLVQSNVHFGTEVLEAAALAGIRTFVNTGTSWQNYQDAAYSPMNLYAATKQAFEAILSYYVEARGMKAVTLRLFDTYGPRDPRPKLIPSLMKSLRTNCKELALSPGEQKLDLLHIDDVTNGFEAGMARAMDLPPGKHEVYGLAANERVDLKELVAILEQITGRKAPIKWGERPYRYREVMIPWTKSVNPPGWSQKIPLREGLKHIWDSHV